jgi:hypothetical protein
MRNLLKLGFRAAPFVVAAIVAAGCADSTASVDPGASGFKAINSGDYATARDVLAPLHAKDPHNPYYELNLAVAYENLGHMDMAEPLYRGVLVDGKGVVPGATSNGALSGQSLADIACANLKLGLKNEAAC